MTKGSSMSKIPNAFETLRPKSEPGEYTGKRIKGMALDSNGRPVVSIVAKKMAGFSPITKEDIGDVLARRLHHERMYQASLLSGSSRGKYR